MANTILIKNDTTSGNVPSALTEAEIAINTADAILYTKNHAGTIVKIGALNDLAVTVSGTNTYTATLFPVPASYAAIQGRSVFLLFTNSNTSSASLNLNTIGPINLVKYGINTLISGDIASGQYLEVVYDGTNFQILDSIPVPSTINTSITSLNSSVSLINASIYPNIGSPVIDPLVLGFPGSFQNDLCAMPQSSIFGGSFIL